MVRASYRSYGCLPIPQNAISEPALFVLYSYHVLDEKQLSVH